MNPQEYFILQEMEKLPAWKLLQDIWMAQLAKIEVARDKAAGRSQESAWRYWAGQEKGFKLAMTSLKIALLEMEREIEQAEGQSKADELWNEIQKTRGA